MTLPVQIEQMQILQGCIIVRGSIVARREPRLELALAGRRLLTKVNWIGEPRPRPLRRLAARLRPPAGEPRPFRFVARALAGWDVDASAAGSLVLSVSDGQQRTTLGDLLRTGGAALEPGPDAIYSRFRSEVFARPRPSILELGSRARSGHERRDHFPDTHYVGFDIKPGPGVDVVGDAHRLSACFPPDSFEFATSISVFEHLAWPWKAVLELGQVLKQGGLVYTQSHQTWPLHDAPWDFYRFSRSAWISLFSEATGFEVVEAADLMPARVVPLQQSGDPAIAVERGTGYLMSACLARKTGPAKVAWDAVPELERLLPDYPA